MNVTLYKDWSITYNPKPVVNSRIDYDAVHHDYDGPEDPRHFSASTEEKCITIIDEEY